MTNYNNTTYLLSKVLTTTLYRPFTTSCCSNDATEKKARAHFADEKIPLKCVYILVWLRVRCVTENVSINCPLILKMSSGKGRDFQP